MKIYCEYCGAYLETLPSDLRQAKGDKVCYDCGLHAAKVKSEEGLAMLYLFGKMIERLRG